MNTYYHLGKVLTSLVLAVASGAAVAGEPVGSSRGKVTIKATIPHRFHIQTLTSEMTTDRLDRVSRQICVSANVRQLTYRMIPADAGSRKVESLLARSAAMDSLLPSSTACESDADKSRAANSSVPAPAMLNLPQRDSSELFILLVAAE